MYAKSDVFIEYVFVLGFCKRIRQVSLEDHITPWLGPEWVEAQHLFHLSVSKIVDNFFRGKGEHSCLSYISFYNNLEQQLSTWQQLDKINEMDVCIWGWNFLFLIVVYVRFSIRVPNRMKADAYAKSVFSFLPMTAHLNVFIIY